MAVALALDLALALALALTLALAFAGISTSPMEMGMVLELRTPGGFVRGSWWNLPEPFQSQRSRWPIHACSLFCVHFFRLHFFVFPKVP